MEGDRRRREDGAPPKAGAGSRETDRLSFGRILKRIAQKEGIGGKALKGRRLAAKVVFDVLQAHGVPPNCAMPRVTAVRTGIMVLEVDNSALLQEIESFHRAALMKALSAAGMDVREIRVRLPRGPAGGSGRSGGE